MFSVGQQFGNYTLIRQLGRGGYGEVWLAERRTKFATTQVAIKLPLDEQVDHAVIEKEAQLWARASGHANVLPIIEANEYDGQIVIVSEYAMDGSLDALLRRNGGALPAKQAVEITIGILKGLEYLHSRSIIHRDVKPANIVLQGDTPRLTDFGISRVLKTTSQVTNVVGTPYYMAPEAFQRHRNAQTDVWSVGVLLYQMLKGELPFLGDNIADLFGAIVLSQPEPLPDFIPSRLQQIVWTALSKEVSGRYRTARAMRDVLDDCWLGLSPHVPMVTENPEVLPKGDETTTLNIATLPQIGGEQAEVIEKHNSVLDAPAVLAPATPEIRTWRPSPYYAIPAIVLLLAVIISAGYMLRNKAGDITQTSDNTNTPDVVAEAAAGATDPLIIPFRKGDKFGFSDMNKKLVIEAKYDDAFIFSEGLARVESNKKWGFIDKAGQEVVPPIYDEATEFSEGLARVAKDGKYGFIDKAGNKVVPLIYETDDGLSGIFEDGLTRVKLNDKYGVIDKVGSTVVPLKYNYIGSFSHGIAEVRVNDKWGLVSRSGDEVVPPKYDDMELFSDGLAGVKLGGFWGFVDKNGIEVITPKYSLKGMPPFLGARFNEGLVGVALGGKVGFIDKVGTEVIPFKYQFASPFNEGLAAVGFDGKLGFIDKQDREVIPFKFTREVLAEYVGVTFTEGLVAVMLNGKYCIIDRTGTQLVPPRYDGIFFLPGPLIEVRLGEKYGFVDRSGNLVVPAIYDGVGSFEEGIADVLRNGKWGFVDKTGREVVAPKYDESSSFGKHVARVKLNGKYLFIDKSGTEYYQP